jgi:integrase
VSRHCSGKPSSVWWARYYVNGRKVRESTGTDDKKAARDFLKAREGAVVKGEPVMVRVDKVKYDELANDLRTYYRTTGKRDLVEVGWRLNHLDAFFTGVRVVTITPARITEYIAARQQPRRCPDGAKKPGASNGSINRELTVLGAMLRRGYHNGKVLRLPRIEKLEEAPPRAGFFEDHQYQAVRRKLDHDLQVAATVAHTYGWRTQSEIMTRQWRHIDLQAGTLRLEPGESKNDDGRLRLPYRRAEALLTAQRGRVEALQRQLGKIVPWVFPHFVSGPCYQAGNRRKDYRRAWAAACKAAGVPGRLRHDMRRTAVRNMERRAIARSVAMKITGHRTESIYKRYAIVSDADLQEATRKLTGTFLGTLATVAENPASEVARI